MLNNKSFLAIITARGGSKEVPGKNIRIIMGKPLIAWTIDAALKTKYIDRVIVTTDSEEIQNISIKSGADAPFLRPDNISGDNAKQEDAILHAMDYLSHSEGKRYDYLVILTPAHPVRDEVEINSVIEKIVTHPKAKCIVTMIESKASPLICNQIPEDLSLKNFLSEDVKLKNRQELPTYYQPSGSTSVVEWSHFLEKGTIFTDETYAYKTDNKTGHDINSEIDFLLAEELLKEKFSVNK